MELVLNPARSIDSGHAKLETYGHPDTGQEVLTIKWKDNKITSIVAYLFDRPDTIFELTEKQGSTKFDIPGTNEQHENLNKDPKDTPKEWIDVFLQMMGIYAIGHDEPHCEEQRDSIVKVLNTIKEKQ